jgi:hypothetical protein
MNLLQPWMIYALPLVALPVVIHLIHRRRQRVIEWGAMRFLLARSRLSRGLQKLRHFLILACRVLAVLALVFALGRPMTGGWLGSVAGVGADTVIVIVDRSASMATEAQGRSRLEAGLARLVDALQVVHAKKWRILDGATGEFVDVDSPRDVLQLPAARSAATHSDLPALFETAIQELAADRGGRAEIWVCSDLQAGDWDPSNGRWDNIRRQLTAMQGTVDVHLLSLAAPTPSNLAVRVHGVEYRKHAGGEGGELALDVEVQREQPTDTPVAVPLTLAFANGRSVVDLQLQGATARGEGIVIPLPGDAATGWGRVELPADDNPMDNVYFLTYGSEPVRRSVVVAEDAALLPVLALAAESSLRDDLEHLCTPLPLERAAELELNDACLLVWQGPLPAPALLERIDAFVDLGGCVLFLPSREGASADYRGVRWEEWIESAGDQVDSPVTWREDADLLANADDGKPLPLGRIEVYRSRRLSGPGTVLARLKSERPLLLRAPTDRGGVYFLATLPLPETSNMARQGIVLVAMVQRALEEGVKGLRPGLQYDAGADLGDRGGWEQVVGYGPDVLSLEQHLFPGVLRRGDRTVALNRPVSEDASATLDAAELEQMFAGIDVTISFDDGTDDTALVEEIWKLFLVLLALALVGESMLSLADLGRRVAA